MGTTEGAPDVSRPLTDRGRERAPTDVRLLLLRLRLRLRPTPSVPACASQPQRYVHCAGEDRTPRLLCGPVAYLPPPPSNGYDLDRLGELADPHPARPRPAEGQTLRDGDPRLFWSLSFAVRPDVWRSIGGFCEQCRGYSGEDTDFGQHAAAAGVRLDWTGGALAYHQFHPSGDSPVEHVDDILANARVFFRRWGWWPMTGWLTVFQRLGLAHFEAADGWRGGPGH